jgi:hypothetical protein
MGHPRKFADPGWLEHEAQAGHSAVFLDARWLGERTVDALAGHGSIEGPFCLIGTKTLLRLSRWRGRLTFTLPRHRLEDWEPFHQFPSNADWAGLAVAAGTEAQPDYLFERRLSIELEDDGSKQRLEHPKPWRMETRTMLKESRSITVGPSPFLLDIGNYISTKIRRGTNSLCKC